SPPPTQCPEPEVRDQIRGRLDDAGCVAPPRNSANYSLSSRLASAADPPPTLATDFGSGTLDVDVPDRAPGWSRESGRRRLFSTVLRSHVAPGAVAELRDAPPGTALDAA